jgi:hypothetical protein
MATKAEITKRYVQAYARADKTTKAVILDQVVDVAGWSRGNARHRLARAARTGIPPPETGSEAGKPAVTASTR